MVLTGVGSKNDRFVRKKAGSHGEVVQIQQLIRKIPHFYGQVMTDVKKGRRSRSRKIIILSHPPHTTRDITRDTTDDTTSDITSDITSDTTSDTTSDITCDITSDIDARGCLGSSFQPVKIGRMWSKE